MSNLLQALISPILLQGDERTGYRDPAVLYHEGVFHLFYTLVETEDDGQVYMYTATCVSRDLAQWSKPCKLTPRHQRLNFSSPGNLIRFGDEWVMCLQTYPRPNGEKYGTEDSRIWIMRSRDLAQWSEPELLRLKGEEVPINGMGRMIDPYLVEDDREPGLWWCFYKQNGVSLSHSRDLKDWTYSGHHDAGENVCIIRKDREYVMFHSPENGIGVMRSTDLREWRHEEGLITLGQSAWEWAKGRITAGFVLDARDIADVGSYLMFFHGTGPADESVIFDTHACIGLAWSKDLVNWEWPLPVWEEK